MNVKTVPKPWGHELIFAHTPQYVGKMLACLKYALELDGVISSSHVCPGTQALSWDEKQTFIEAWGALHEQVQQTTKPWWQTTRL